MNLRPSLIAASVLLLAGGCAGGPQPSPAPPAPPPAAVAPPPAPVAPAPVAEPVRQAAEEPDPSTREGRMAEALRNYEAAKKADAAAARPAPKSAKAPAKSASAGRR